MTWRARHEVWHLQKQMIKKQVQNGQAAPKDRKYQQCLPVVFLCAFHFFCVFHVLYFINVKTGREISHGFEKVTKLECGTTHWRAETEGMLQHCKSTITAQLCLNEHSSKIQEQSCMFCSKAFIQKYHVGNWFNKEENNFVNKIYN